jgi:hypothetical protein
LLYAGTEQGMYISFDDGEHWKPLQLNLPIVPITDLAVKNNDLIVATQGRSFWVLDDLTPLHQFQPAQANKALHAYTPRPAFRVGGGGPDMPSKTAGQNPPNGVVLYYRLKEAPKKESPVSLDILDRDGQVVRRFSTHPPTKGKAKPEEIKAAAGLNRFVWDLRYTPPENFPGMVLWGGLTAPRAVPGAYRARLRVGDVDQEVAVRVVADPRSTASLTAMQEQFDFVAEVGAKLTEVHRSIKKLRETRDQLQALVKLLDEKKQPEAVKSAKRIIDAMTAVEEALHQTKAKSSQDVLNYPVRLNNKLSSLASGVAFGDDRPTDQAVKLKHELFAATDSELSRLRQIFAEDLPRFNADLRRLEVPAVIVPDEE